MQRFSQLMQHLVAGDSINVILGEFSKLSDIFTDLAQIVNKPILSK